MPNHATNVADPPSVCLHVSIAWSRVLVVHVGAAILDRQHGRCIDCLTWFKREIGPNEWGPTVPLLNPRLTR